MSSITATSTSSVAPFTLSAPPLSLFSVPSSSTTLDDTHPSTDSIFNDFFRFDEDFDFTPASFGAELTPDAAIGGLTSSTMATTAALPPTLFPSMATHHHDARHLLFPAFPKQKPNGLFYPQLQPVSPTQTSPTRMSSLHAYLPTLTSNTKHQRRMLARRRSNPKHGFQCRRNHPPPYRLASACVHPQSIALRAPALKWPRC
jgi:hypothetical protein